MDYVDNNLSTSCPYKFKLFHLSLTKSVKPETYYDIYSAIDNVEIVPKNSQ